MFKFPEESPNILGLPSIKLTPKKIAPLLMPVLNLIAQSENVPCVIFMKFVIAAPVCAAIPDPETPFTRIPLFQSPPETPPICIAGAELDMVKIFKANTVFNRMCTLYSSYPFFHTISLKP